MKYQVVIAGFGGQGVVFLVKVLSIASSLKNEKCLGTENHGMSQRGGSVSCYVKIGDFSSPAIDEGQADLLIALESDEALRNVQFLQPKKGVIVVNADKKFPKLDYETIKIDAFAKANKNIFNIQALNVYMLGIVLKSVRDFPFTQADIEQAIHVMNEKVAEKNITVLRQAIKDASEEEI
ncbi:MAG: 2-oxoacid:acceptor oxidoreductase family protein [Campylobacteraceae bacterium]|jgi:indolepyruvate ferredoxin oxidoreductase beta subunit|nr:2-oxoacid:acceptor oxidoreductase family protein [Campylobacteraceae bacterium]